MLDLDKIYSSNNYGDFKIIKYVSCAEVHISFLATGFNAVVRADSVKNGGVKDYLKPSVFGVGFIGIGEHKPWHNNKNTKAYQTWSGMLERCYCTKYQARKPTYIGCTTDIEWHNFQTFAGWFDKNYEDGLHLDKDIKVKGNKVYSPEKCTFVSVSENSVEANAVRCAFMNPYGEIINVYNISEFARNNNLNSSHLSAVNTGKRKHHKGWRKPPN